MLILSRKKEQKIIINSDITITVLDVHDGMVSIGIDAPKDVPVDRQEAYDRKRMRSEDLC